MLNAEGSTRVSPNISNFLRIPGPVEAARLRRSTTFTDWLALQVAVALSTRRDCGPAVWAGSSAVLFRGDRSSVLAVLERCDGVGYVVSHWRTSSPAPSDSEWSGRVEVP
jgi:hypothetical protein